MNIQMALKHLLAANSFTCEQMATVMQQVMAGGVTHAQLGALVTALNMKGISSVELLATVQVLRQKLKPVPIMVPNLVDNCGTGGDGAGLFNVSTAAAFVAAAGGAQVAKHGNRGQSSNTGSADVFEQAGIDIELSPDQVAQSIERLGLGFMFAPAHHSALRQVVAARAELGFRTIFNLVGPLVNPAGVKRQVVGVFSNQYLSMMAEVLRELGSEHVLVVHARDGLDEFSLAAPTQVCELKDGSLQNYEVTPEMVGLMSSNLDDLKVESAQDSWLLIQAALNGATQSSATILKAIQLIAYNAGAVLYVAGCAANIEEGVQKALTVIQSGAALSKISALAAFTGELANTV